MSGLDRRAASAGSAGVRLRPLLWLAAGCACVLVAALGLEYHSAVKRETRLAHSLSAPRAVPSMGAAGTARSGQASPAPDLVEGWSRTALARPLFSRWRGPMTRAVSGPSQPRLAGIIVGPGGARAIFAGDGSARGTVAAVGQQAGDWKVLAISADTVQVTGPNGTHTLRPSRNPGGAEPASPIPPEHPSILDLLRSRTLNVGPFGQQPGGSPFVGGAPQ